MKAFLVVTALGAAMARSLAEPVPVPVIEAPTVNGVQTVGRIVNGFRIFYEPVSTLEICLNLPSLLTLYQESAVQVGLIRNQYPIQFSLTLFQVSG